MYQVKEPSPQPERLFERALDGVHEAALSCLTPYLKRESSILDLGAGTGAWAKRLLDSGHCVTCVEHDMEGFALDSVHCINADLNENFSTAIKGKYDAITSIEVIEHLENPRHFLRQCRNLLYEEGVLLITTPNIECIAGRMRFLVSGHFRMFDRDERLNDPTHITPIQTFLFEKMIKETGYKLLSHETNNSAPRITNIFARLICKPFTPLVSGFKGGDSHIFVIARD